jgi:hypothetical protein
VFGPRIEIVGGGHYDVRVLGSYRREIGQQRADALARGVRGE